METELVASFLILTAVGVVKVATASFVFWYIGGFVIEKILDSQKEK